MPRAIDEMNLRLDRLEEEMQKRSAQLRRLQDIGSFN